MGIKLVSEVLDHYHGPDARKLWLLAWAEKANDKTRAGWPTREVLAHRTGRSPSRVSHVADELVTEGVLKRDGGGNRSGPARFILLPLCAPGKSAPSAHPSDDAADTEMGAPRAHSSDGGKDAPQPHPKTPGKSAPKTHPNEPGKGASRAHPQPEVKGAESARKGAESARKGADPSPRPAETGSLLLINPHIEQPSENLPADARAPTAQTILASFIDWVRANGGNLTKRTIGLLARQTGDLLAQGIPDRFIRKGLADWHASGQHPSTLDSFVNAAMNADARARSSPNGRSPRPSTTDQRVAEAQALKARLASRQEPA